MRRRAGWDWVKLAVAGLIAVTVLGFAVLLVFGDPGDPVRRTPPMPRHGGP